MGQPAAKQGDQITAMDEHTVIVQGAPTKLPFPFAGVINGGLSTDVNIDGRPAAVVGSTADNVPPHLAAGGAFAVEPSNKATIQAGSATVNINGKSAARHGDKATTCSEGTQPAGTVNVVSSTVVIG
jgi:uncharacterized Zn-binding protein involved in type VI secretion